MAKPAAGMTSPRMSFSRADCRGLRPRDGRRVGGRTVVVRDGRVGRGLGDALGRATGCASRAPTAASRASNSCEIWRPTVESAGALCQISGRTAFSTMRSTCSGLKIARDANIARSSRSGTTSIFGVPSPPPAGALRVMLPASTNTMSPWTGTVIPTARLSRSRRLARGIPHVQLREAVNAHPVARDPNFLAGAVFRVDGEDARRADHDVVDVG